MTNDKPALGGILLVLVSVLALGVANSPLAGAYDNFLNDTYIGIDGLFRKNVLHWINDGLMAVFFLLIGLEIKREVVQGRLSSKRQAMLPALAALGGMVVPAAIYAVINRTNPEFMAGWAIPCATDIAFALGILALLGNRIPVALKILLLAVAIIDDLGAIIIIALFYTAELHIYALLFAALPVAALFMLNRAGVQKLWPYLLCGLILWAAVLESGVHATLAGVITALFIPLGPGERLEHRLHPWVLFAVMPVFAFANAGVSFAGITPAFFGQPLTLGIISGLFLGKQAGIFASIWLAVKSGLCDMPKEANWKQIYGLSLLCGIGFTMSLFIGGLAFPGEELQAAVRLGVLTGSVLSAISAYMILRLSTRKE